ncbi:MAG: nucleotide-binding protein [Pseudomonadota bacterium]
MSSTELFKIANTLDPYIEFKSDEVDTLIEAATSVGKSWSGSWLGYHSRVYYENFETPPAGAEFSQEWGLKDSISMGTTGAWRKQLFDDVVSYIYEKANNPNLETFRESTNTAREIFDEAKASVLSLIHANFNLESDKFLAGMVEKLDLAEMYEESDFITYWRPDGQVMSRDIVALEKGRVTPPHIIVLAKANYMTFPFKACKELRKLIIKIASHIKNIEGKDIKDERIGTNIFIGHGRSSDWRELKDFVSDRLKLPWDEFNRVPVAGVTNVTRLVEMLDQASFAFLVMTGEDEQTDGNHHARMNVIHEVGLFQGRLGFERAIVLLEEGCEEFSNIQGLGQIRFPKNNIAAIFEDIRAILEREEIVG